MMEYVCSGATLRCSMGTATSRLIATPKKVLIQGKDKANIDDHIPKQNVQGFGNCCSLAYPSTARATASNHGILTPRPCHPGTCFKWQTLDANMQVNGKPALLRAAKLKCKYGGVISIINSGQSLVVKNLPVVIPKMEEEQLAVKEELPEEILQEFSDLNTQGLDKDSVFDGIQATLDVLGMAPGVGAIPDLINAAISAVRGDWVGAGLSLVAAVPGIGDAVGGAKIAYRGAKLASKGVKQTAKGANQVATQQTAKRTQQLGKGGTFSSQEAKNTSKSQTGRGVKKYDDNSDNMTSQVNGNNVQNHSRGSQEGSNQRSLNPFSLENGNVNKQTYYKNGNPTEYTTIQTNAFDSASKGSGSSYDSPNLKYGIKIQDVSDNHRLGDLTFSKSYGQETGKLQIEINPDDPPLGNNPFSNQFMRGDELPTFKEPNTNSELKKLHEKGEEKLGKQQLADNQHYAEKKPSDVDNPYTATDEAQKQLEKDSNYMRQKKKGLDYFS